MTKNTFHYFNSGIAHLIDVRLETTYNEMVIKHHICEFIQYLSNKTKNIRQITKFLVGFTLLILISTLYSPINIIAQDTFDDFTYKSIQSPNAYSLGKFGEIPVGLYNGIPNISIPLTEIKAGSFSLPISLDYHAGGIKAQEIASWAGLGWSVNAGGVITRSVRGYNDMDSNIGYFYNQLDLDEIFSDPMGNTAQTIYQSLDRYASQTYLDSEPDIFFYNFAGYSGKFVLPHGKGNYQDWSSVDIYTIPHSNLEIQIVRYDTSFSDLDGEIRSFHITNEEGVKFIFDKIEVSAGYLQLSGNVDGRDNIDITSWYLSRVETPSSEEDIQLLYTDLPQNLKVKRYTDSKQNIVRTSSIINPSYNNSQDSLWNKSVGIPRNTQSVTFQFNIKLLQIENDEYRLEFVTSSTPDRLDAPRQEYNSCFGCNLYMQEYKLQGINLIRKSNTGDLVVKKWIFNHGYFNNTVPTEITETTSSAPDLFKRLKLLSLEISDSQDNIAQTYSFEYYEPSFEYKRYDQSNDEFVDFEALYNLSEPPKVTLPPYLDYVEELYPVNGIPIFQMKHSPAFDHWGYFNGDFTNPIYNIPYYDYEYYNMPRYVNREINEQATISGTLSKLVYPTGGYSVFEYESNDFNSFGNQNLSSKHKAGGIRIKKIKNFDGVSSEPQIQKFYYTENYPDTSNSSGSLLHPPLYLSPALRGFEEDFYFDLHESSLIPLGTTLGGIIGYKEVTVLNDINNEGGYKTSYFSSPESYPDRAKRFFIDALPSDTTLILQVESSNRNNYYQHSPYATMYFNNNDRMLWGMGYRTSLDFRRGRLLKNELFNASNKRIEKTVNEYSDQSINITKGLSVKNFESQNEGSSGVSFVIHYEHISSWNYLKEQKNITYGPSTNDSLFTVTKFTYDDANHLQLTKKEEINSLTSEERTTEYEYAHKITNDGTGKNYSVMAGLNMLSQPYSVTVKDGSNVLSKKWIRWDNIFGGNRWYPEEYWVWKGSSVDDNPSTSIGIQTATINNYDSYGNPLEIEDAYGIRTAYDWSEDGTTLIGIFSNSEANDIFAHSFAYDGLEGWAFVDRYDDSDTEVSVINGMLKLKNYSTAQNGEFDRIYYDHGSEITQDLVWEFDVKIANSDNWDLQMNAGGSGWNTYSVNSETAVWTAINNEAWRVYNGSSWITLKSELNVGKTYNFRIVMHPGSNTADYYLNGEEVGSAISFRQGSSGIQKITFGNYGYGTLTTEWYIDNVRMYPKTAQAKSLEAHQLFSSPVAIKDVSGSTSRFEYDSFGRLSSTYNENEALTSSYRYDFSPILNGGTYDPENPNKVESFSPLETTSFSFANSSGWSKIGDGTFNVSYAGETTLRLGANGTNWSRVYRYIGTDNFVSKVDFYPVSATNSNSYAHELYAGSERFIVRYNATNDRFDVYTLLSGQSGVWTTSAFKLNAPPNNWYTIEIEKNNDGTIRAWVYPKGGLRNSDGDMFERRGFQQNWNAYVRFYSKVDYYYLANYEVYKGTHKVSYLDGLGREIQTQQRGEVETIITSLMYNERGLQEVVSRPFEMPGRSTYVSNALAFGSGFTPTIALTSGELFDEYGSTSGGGSTPYTYSGYEASPLERVVESRMPGGSNYATTNTYGINDVEEFDVFEKEWGTGTLQKTVTRDSDGTETITYTDGWGQTIVSGVNMNPNSDDILDKTSSDLVTYFEYDLLGNLERVEDPKGLVTSYNYNELGQLDEKEIPDQNGTNRYKYDKVGNLRFVQSPNHISNGSSSTLHNQFWYSERTVNLNMPGQGVMDYNVAKVYGSTTLNFYIKDPIDITVKSLSLNIAGNNHTGIKVVRPGTYKFISDHINYSGSYMLAVEIKYKPFTYTYYNYDSLNRVIETGEVYSDSFSNADPDGNTSSSTYPTIKYFYDDENKHPAAQNVNGRIARVEYRNLESSDDWGTTWYSYNELGLVEWIRHQLPDKPSSWDKKIQYTYDELGRVKRVFYDSSQDPLNTNDDHYFWYYYDGIGRVAQITSNRLNDQQSAYPEAQYSYYADGQIKELNLGELAQSVDYKYTVQGWLDMINKPTTTDIGSDKFAMDLGYSANGNITTQKWMQPEIQNNASYYYHYEYDTANRLDRACYGSVVCNTLYSYDVDYEYDKNGNIVNLLRKDNSQAPYHSLFGLNTGELEFFPNSNKLKHIYHQPGNVPASKRYFEYDANGNMKKNDIQEIINATYDWRNLPTNTTTSSGTVNFAYDADGNRIKKEVSGGNPTWYIRGADGEVIAVYSGNNLLYINIPGGIGRINK